MKKLVLLTLAALLVAPCAFAMDLGTNITVFDGTGYDSSWSTWYEKQEDNEVEPYAATGQEWDLEAIYYDALGATISVVGGFDFVNGEDGIDAGDLFIDVTGDAVIPAAANSGLNEQINNVFGYDYVLDIDFSALTFDIYAIGSESVLLQSVNEETMQASNPYAYVSGGKKMNDDAIAISYLTGVSDAEVGLLGGYHNIASFSVDFLSGYDYFTAVQTMECGNDKVVGRHPVPEPATMALFGLGLVGLATRRKK